MKVSAVILAVTIVIALGKGSVNTKKPQLFTLRLSRIRLIRR